jgi:hypothetical protein
MPRGYKWDKFRVSQLWDICQPVRTLAEDIFRIHYQEMNNVDVEDFMFAAVTVIFRVCKPVRMLQLLVVASCVYKCSVNQSPIQTLSIVTHALDNIYIYIFSA